MNQLDVYNWLESCKWLLDKAAVVGSAKISPIWQTEHQKAKTDVTACLIKNFVEIVEQFVCSFLCMFVYCVDWKR